ncbi:hypothetical protein ACP275_08G054000 [Erythranthe tilingii]
MESFNHRYSHLDVDTKRQYVNFGNRLLSLIKSDAYLQLDGNTDFTIKRVPYNGTSSSTTPVDWPEWSFDAGNELPPSGFDADNESPGGFDAGNESPGGFDAGNESRPDGFDADNESPVQTQSGNGNRCRDQTTAGQTDPPNPDGSGPSPQPEIPSNPDGVRSSPQISNSSPGKRKTPTPPPPPPPPEETNCAKNVKRTKIRHGSPGKRKTRQFGALDVKTILTNKILKDWITNTENLRRDRTTVWKTKQKKRLRNTDVLLKKHRIRTKLDFSYPIFTGCCAQLAKLATIPVPQNLEISTPERIISPSRNLEPNTSQRIISPPRNLEPNTSQRIISPPRNLQPNTSQRIISPSRNLEPNTSQRIISPSRNLQPNTSQRIISPPRNLEPSTTEDIISPLRNLEPNTSQRIISPSTSEHIISPWQQTRCHSGGGGSGGGGGPSSSSTSTSESQGSQDTKKIQNKLNTRKRKLKLALDEIRRKFLDRTAFAYCAMEILMVEMPTKWHKKAANALMDQTRSSLEKQFNIRGVGVIDASSLNDDLQQILTATTTSHQIYLEFEDQNWYFETSTMWGDDKKRFGKLYSHLEKLSQEYKNYMKQKQRAQAATDDQEQATSSSIQH